MTSSDYRLRSRDTATALTLADRLNEILQSVDLRIGGIEDQSTSIAEMEAALSAYGTDRVATVLAPVVAAIEAAAGLGALLTTTSGTACEISTGLREFAIPSPARGVFAPASILSVVADDDPTAAMLGRRVSWSAETGALVLDVIAAGGSGVHTSWTISAAAAVENAGQVRTTPQGVLGGATLADQLVEIAAALAVRQPQAANLTALAGLSLVGDRTLITDATGAPALVALGLVGKALLASADKAAARTAIDAAPITSAQLLGEPTAPTAPITADSNRIVNVTALRAAVSAVIGAAPAVIDTIAEAAAALGNDPNFAATVFAQLASKQPISSLLGVYSTGTARLLTDVGTDDLNQDLESGWYSVGGATFNAPVGATGVVFVGRRAYDSGRQQQLFLAAAGFWWRYGSRSGSTLTWGAWQRVAATSSADQLATTDRMIAGHTDSITLAQGIAAKIQAHATGAGSGFGAVRWSADNGGVNALRGGKSRSGTVGTHAAVQSGDAILVVSADASDGSAFQPAASIVALVDGTPAAGSVPGRIAIYTTPVGGAAPVERIRIDAAGNLQMGGANTIVDAARTIIARSYTIATLPSPAVGGIVYCSDLARSGGLLVSTGAAWMRLNEYGSVAVTTDADMTLTPLLSAPDVFHTATLAAARTITLSTTNAYDGARFRVSRTGAGAFTLSVGGLKSLSQNQWCEVVYSGAGNGWRLAAYGTL